MAINPTREQTRLTKSREAGKAVLNEIEQTKVKIQNLNGDLDQLQVKSTLEENALIELNIALTTASAIEVKTDETVADIARIANEMKEHQEQLTLISQEYTDKRQQRDEFEIQLAALLNGPTMLKISLQEKALAKQEAAYPALLKRHLRKCRKYGWTDNRLASAKKK
jgi:hypothetical protein